MDPQEASDETIVSEYGISSKKPKAVCHLEGCGRGISREGAQTLKIQRLSWMEKHDIPDLWYVHSHSYICTIHWTRILESMIKLGEYQLSHRRSIVLSETTSRGIDTLVRKMLCEIVEDFDEFKKFIGEDAVQESKTNVEKAKYQKPDANPTDKQSITTLSVSQPEPDSDLAWQIARGRVWYCSLCNSHKNVEFWLEQNSQASQKLCSGCQERLFECQCGTLILESDSYRLGGTGCPYCSRSCFEKYLRLEEPRCPQSGYH